jgi:hypothetical protein
VAEVLGLEKINGNRILFKEVKMKPRPVIHSYKYPDGKKGKMIIAEVFSDFWSDDFAEKGDPISARFDVKIFDELIFEGFDPKNQVKISRRLAEFLLRYAEWLEYKVYRQDKLKIRIK